MALYSRQGSARLGAGAAASPDNASGQAPATGSAPSSAVPLSSLTAGATGQTDQRATGNVRRTARGLGRRAEDAARSFYSTDDRYTRNAGADYTKAEDPKVYSNDAAETAPVPLSQATPTYTPPKPVVPTAAPAPAPAVQAPQTPAPVVTAPVAAPAAAPAAPVMNLAAPKPATPPASASDLVSTYVAPGTTQTLQSNPVDTYVAPGTTQSLATTDAGKYVELGTGQSLTPPTRQLISSPDVPGFLQAQKRILGR